MKILCKRTIVSLLICSILSLNISGSDPIAYMKTLGYSPAQIETAESNNGMVSTQHFLATRVGEKILNKGKIRLIDKTSDKEVMIISKKSKRSCIFLFREMYLKTFKIFIN